MQKSASYEHLRTIGCLCYPAIKTSNNFAPRAKRYILLDYPYAHKGYKLFDLGSHKIILSRDVISMENDFPFRPSFIPTSIPTPSSSSHTPLTILDVPFDGLSSSISNSDSSIFFSKHTTFESLYFFSSYFISCSLN